MQVLNQMGRFHGNCDAGAVIDGTGAEVPGIEVARNNNNLFRLFTAFDVGNDVGTFAVRQNLGRKNQFHFHCSFTRERCD